MSFCPFAILLFSTFSSSSVTCTCPPYADVACSLARAVDRFSLLSLTPCLYSTQIAVEHFRHAPVCGKHFELS